MAERSEDQILDQAVYAVACVARHYGPGLNEYGLAHLRECLSKLVIFTDACYTVDVYDDDPYADFSSRIVWPSGWDKMDYDETMARMREGENE